MAWAETGRNLWPPPSWIAKVFSSSLISMEMEMEMEGEE
jgi:hypothetical protein